MCIWARPSFSLLERSFIPTGFLILFYLYEAPNTCLSYLAYDSFLFFIFYFLWSNSTQEKYICSALLLCLSLACHEKSTLFSTGAIFYSLTFFINFERSFNGIWQQGLTTFCWITFIKPPIANFRCHDYKTWSINIQRYLLWCHFPKQKI